MYSDGRPAKAAGVKVLLVVISASESKSKAVVVNDGAAGVYLEEADAADLVKSRRAAGDGSKMMTGDLGTVSSTKDM